MNRNSIKFNNKPNIVNIKYLPKDELLYQLWKKARNIPYLDVDEICEDDCDRTCSSKYLDEDLILTREQAKKDVAEMPPGTFITYYFGRTLFVDITSDDFICNKYDQCNGRRLANKIVNIVKVKELYKLALRHYLS